SANAISPAPIVPFVPPPTAAPLKSTREAVEQLQQMAAMSAPIRHDGQPLPQVYALRIPENRLKAVEELGGNVRTEQSVETALSWLAANQSADGRWSPSRLEGGRETQEHGHNREGAGAKADTGVSALVILAFLGAGHTHLEGDYRRNVQYALEFLMRNQAQDGSLAGDAKFYARMYCHGMATLAISEAYAMTGDGRLKPFVEKAVQYTVNSQHPLGGWRYKPGEEGDMSQFGWQVMALKSAELAGVETPTETRIGMIRFLRLLSSGTHGGLAAYKRKSGPSPTMTAEALMCRHYIGMNRNRQAIVEAMDYVHAKPPVPGKANYYYWYYGTLSLFQSKSPRWEQWNRQMQTELLSRQRTDGAMAGSWNPDSVWGGYGGRAYTTALAALTLEVYYRYLPVYQD
ncbi:MAG: squalene cyclase, partial [Pirellulaceae bacterium]